MEVDFVTFFLIGLIILLALYLIGLNNKTPKRNSSSARELTPVITVTDLIESLLEKIRSNPNMEVKELLSELASIVEGINALCTDETCKVARLNLADPEAYLKSIQSVLDDNPGLGEKVSQLITVLSQLSDKTKTTNQ